MKISRLTLLIPLYFLTAGCDRHAITTIQIPSGTELTSSESGLGYSSPVEMNVSSLQAKALSIVSFNAEVIAMFVSEEADAMIPGFGGGSDDIMRPRIGNLFFIDDIRVIVIPEQATRLLFASAWDDTPSATIDLQVIDAPPINDNFAPKSTRLVKFIDGEYIVVEPIALTQGDEFYIEAVYAREPTEENRSLRLSWDNGSEKWVEVTKTNENPNLFRSIGIVIGEPGDFR